MNIKHFLLFAALMLLNTVGHTQPVKLIFDTDFALDVDDAGALAILHHLSDLGECKILGIGVSSSADYYDGEWAVPCIDAINQYYHRPGIPIGAYRGTNPLFRDSSAYVKQVQAAFPHRLHSGKEVMEAYKLYRKILASQPDSSVILLSVGYLNNLEALLKSGPDEYSPLSGIELVRKKVKEWSCMGGNFPEGKEEFNFNTYASSTRYVLGHWPIHATFGGFELGIQVWSGAVLNQLYRKEDNPVAMCFYCRDKLKNNQSWDELQALYTVRGLAGYFNVVNGWCKSLTIEADSADKQKVHSRNSWVDDPHGLHRYLTVRMSIEGLQKELDTLMSAAPAGR